MLRFMATDFRNGDRHSPSPQKVRECPQSDAHSLREEAAARCPVRAGSVDFSIMSPETKRLLDEAMRLPLAARAEIVVRLIESLDGPSESDADAAWVEEITRRCRAIDSGDAVTSDWESVRARIEREILRR